MQQPDLRIADLRSNNLLKALKNEELEFLLPHIKKIDAERGMVLYEPGDNIKYTYFPCSQAMVTFVVQLEDGKNVETAIVGREGAVGGIVSQGRLPAYCRFVVQFPGNLMRIETLQLEEAKLKFLTLQNLFARYADCMIAQIFQSVACNATHTIEQRTAKWLIATIDRTGEHTILLNQEQLASMLGVGRSYIARVIGSLKNKGVLKTMRGKLSINSIDMLEDISCACNNLVYQHFETVLKGVYPVK